MKEWEFRQTIACMAASNTIKEMMDEWECEFEYAKESFLKYLSCTLDVEEKKLRGKNG